MALQASLSIDFCDTPMGMSTRFIPKGVALGYGCLYLELRKNTGFNSYVLLPRDASSLTERRIS